MLALASVVSQVELQAARKATKTLEATILLKLTTCMDLLLIELTYLLLDLWDDSSIDNILTTRPSDLMSPNSGKVTMQVL